MALTMSGGNDPGRLGAGSVDGVGALGVAVVAAGNEPHHLRY